jgi:hypothetical protein
MKNKNTKIPPRLRSGNTLDSARGTPSTPLGEHPLVSERHPERSRRGAEDRSEASLRAGETDISGFNSGRVAILPFLPTYESSGFNSGRVAILPFLPTCESSGFNYG